EQRERQAVAGLGRFRVAAELLQELTEAVGGERVVPLGIRLAGAGQQQVGLLLRRRRLGGSDRGGPQKETGEQGPGAEAKHGESPRSASQVGRSVRRRYRRRVPWGRPVSGKEGHRAGRLCDYALSQTTRPASTVGGKVLLMVGLARRAAGRGAA